MIDPTSDEQVLAATLYGEARGEGEAGLEAVASVILNRVVIAKATGRKQFGDGSIRSCCLKPWQFSSWNQSDPNRAKLLALDFANPMPILAQCLAVACRAIAGELPDTVGGATFYKTNVLPWPAEWGHAVAPVKVVGHQSFYVLP